MLTCPFSLIATNLPLLRLSHEARQVSGEKAKQSYKATIGPGATNSDCLPSA